MGNHRWKVSETEQARTGNATDYCERCGVVRSTLRLAGKKQGKKVVYRTPGVYETRVGRPDCNPWRLEG